MTKENENLEHVKIEQKLEISNLKYVGEMKYRFIEFLIANLNFQYYHKLGAYFQHHLYKGITLLDSELRKDENIKNIKYILPSWETRSQKEEAYIFAPWEREAFEETSGEEIEFFIQELKQQEKARRKKEQEEEKSKQEKEEQEAKKEREEKISSGDYDLPF